MSYIYYFIVLNSYAHILVLRGHPLSLSHVFAFFPEVTQFINKTSSDQTALFLFQT